jgi:uncharacterized protein with HEPN domain
MPVSRKSSSGKGSPLSNDARRLQDILECAEELEGYLEHIDLDDFLDDTLRQRAIERLLTIIGEAAKQVSAETRDRIDQPWQAIIRFRDKGVHAYDSLTPQRLYRIATESVPALAQAIQEYLRGD